MTGQGAWNLLGQLHLPFSSPLYFPPCPLFLSHLVFLFFSLIIFFTSCSFPFHGLFIFHPMAAGVWLIFMVHVLAVNYFESESY